MSLADHCPNCSELAPSCECIDALVPFLKILSAVERRVSSGKLTSSTAPLFNARAYIDKLTMRLLNPISESDWKSQFTQAHIPFQITRLNDKRWYLRMMHEKFGFYGRLRRTSDGQSEIWELISRPSAFETYADYFNSLSLLIGTDQIETAVIVRIDFAVDYECSFDTFISGLDIVGKRLQKSYVGTTKTGMLVGGGFHKFSVYNKAVESGIDGDLSRIEVQLSGKRLPCRSLANLAFALLKGTMRPFHTTRLGTIKWLYQPEDLSAAQASKLNELKTLIKHGGLYEARKVLDTNRNFERDFSRFFEITPWPNQPDAVLRQSLRLFFETQGAENLD